ncbi:MAG: DNA (cytosine-5-)-methyltransferase [Desulfocapsaceae bacterium]|nr:DNA (cytosine-5-)-methyltransferase [Desulfocapsaceae bacterium]
MFNTPLISIQLNKEPKSYLSSSGASADLHQSEQKTAKYINPIDKQKVDAMEKNEISSLQIMKPSCVNVLDLFSGIGGFSLGLERSGMKTIAFCEIDEFPRRVLRKHWPDVPIYKDIRNLHATDITETVDLICGGLPCQPSSCAGKRRGKEDDRWLWPEATRLVREFEPEWFVFENVKGLVSLNDGLVFDQVLSDLEGEGYTCWTFIIPACAVNAPHRRDRVWIIGHSRRFGSDGYTWWRARKEFKDRYLEIEPTSFNTYSANPPIKRFQRERIQRPITERNDKRWIEVAAGLCRMDDGVSRRLDRSKRLKALGNSVVPQILEIIGRAIMEVS